MAAESVSDLHHNANKLLLHKIQLFHGTCATIKINLINETIIFNIFEFELHIKVQSVPKLKILW